MTECKNIYVPLARLELAIFGLGGRRVIHYATEAMNVLDNKQCIYNKKTRKLKFPGIKYESKTIKNLIDL